jgi:hypothetical protein
MTDGRRTRFLGVARERKHPVLRIVVIACALTGAVALIAASTGKVSQAATGPAQIAISGQQTGYDRLNVGQRRTSPGDMEIVRFRLFNRRVTAEPIGRAELVCTFTTNRSRVCRGTYFLPRGNLVVGGSITFRQFYELAVLGGTGLYDNARGSLVATRINRKPRREFLLFRLVG